MRKSSPEQFPESEEIVEQHEQANFAAGVLEAIKDIFGPSDIQRKLKDFATYHGVQKPVRISGTVLRLALERPERFMLLQGIPLESGQEDNKEKFEQFRKVHDLERPQRVGGSFPAAVLARPEKFALVKGRKKDV